MFSRGPINPALNGLSRYPQLDPRIIDDFVDQFSVSIYYWKAMLCPCTNSLSRQTSLTCHRCRGLGWAYDQMQTDSLHKRALVHSRGAKKTLQPSGTITQGDAVVTFQRGVIPGDGDLIQVCSEQCVVNDEPHTVGARLSDGSSDEVLRFRDVICVENVMIWDRTSNDVITADPSSWTFNAQSRQVQFTNGQPVGTKYSVRYLAIPEYVVMDRSAKPVSRIAHNDQLPEVAHTRKEVVYNYRADVIRLDRAILSGQRGSIDSTQRTTFNSPEGTGRGPFL